MGDVNTTQVFVDGTQYNASDVNAIMANSSIAAGAITESKLASNCVNNTKVANDGLSGDKIHGGIISQFESTGINDDATSNQINITDSATNIKNALNVDSTVRGTSFNSGTTRTIPTDLSNNSVNDFTNQEVRALGVQLANAGGATTLGLKFNLAYDGTDGRWEYISNTGSKFGGALSFDDASGKLRFYNTSSAGANGGAATLTERLSIASDGTLEVSGVASITGLLTVLAGLGLDANCTFTIVSGNPRLTFDSGDYLEYNRSVNGWYFNVGGTDVAVLQGGELSKINELYLKLTTSNHELFGLKGLNGNPVLQFGANRFFEFSLTSDDLDLNVVDGRKFRFSPDGTFTTTTGAGVAGGAVTTGTLTASSKVVAPNACKAFVSWTWNEVPNPDEITIKASYNVASVTRNGDGDWTITFTNAITGGYSVVGVGNGVPSSYPATTDLHSILAVKSGAYDTYALTTSVRIQAENNHNCAFNSVHIF